MQGPRQFVGTCIGPISVAVVALVLAACGALGGSPRFSLLYSPAAQHHGPDRNPIIAIPGILGSRLRDPATGVLAWGALEAGAADPQDPEGARQIALPIGADQAFTDLRDDIVPNGVLEKLHVLLGVVALDIQVYAGVLATLGAGGYRDESLGLGGAVDYGDDHFACFQFDYDWRRDNVENARRLRDFIEEKRAYVQAHSTLNA